MIITLFLCMCFATKNYQVDGWIPESSKYEDIDLEKQLKLINKPPIKTIQTDYGSIVDCIDINKQLAFDNPALKNHKIQLKPSFEGTTKKVKVDYRSANFSSFGMRKNLCPKGTVPVQRTTKEDLMRANNIGILTLGNLGRHFASLRLKVDPVYFGVQGSISAWNPPVLDGQMSEAYIWVKNGKNDAQSNTIKTGWQVYPRLSGDHRTRFFASWSDQIKRTGCTNMLCPGFVQISRKIYLGTPVNATSVYNGPQYSLSLSLVQDNVTKNWWLNAENMQVGYFPAALFSNLMYANHAGWSGSTLTVKNGLSPPMGSGYLPDGNPLHSCYISKMSFKDRYRQDHVPLRGDVYAYADKPTCYDVKYYDYRDDKLQRVLMLGGPGGFCGN